jgi:hypothetical protein
MRSTVPLPSDGERVARVSGESSGTSSRHAVEHRTDELAAGPVSQLGEDECRHLVDVMTHL